jgi:hypothetical protein
MDDFFRIAHYGMGISCQFLQLLLRLGRFQPNPPAFALDLYWHARLDHAIDNFVQVCPKFRYGNSHDSSWVYVRIIS